MNLPRRSLLGAGMALAFAGGSKAAINWPGALVMGTGRPGGSFASFGPAWGGLAHNATEIQFAYRATGGSSANLLLIDEGDAQLGLASVTVAAQARAGTSSWTAGAKLTSFRALFPAYPSVLQIVSSPESGISKIEQLSGQMIGVGPDGASGAAAMTDILSSIGVHPASFVTGDYEAQMSAMQAGKLGACAFIIAPPAPAITTAAHGHRLALIGFSTAQASRAAQLVPGLSPMLLPANSFPGQSVDVSSVGTLNIAVGAASLPDDIAQAITRAALRHRAVLAQAVPAAAAEPDIAPVYQAGISFHPGAARALRQAGIKLPSSFVQS